MGLDLISPNKRLTRVPCAGVQFLPGYPEPFNETIAAHIQAQGRPLDVLEIGAGGLSLCTRVIELEGVASYHCVEPDGSAIDFETIVDHYALGEGLHQSYARKAQFTEATSESFFSGADRRASADLVVSLRVLHFFSPAAFREFLQHAHRALRPGGTMILSGLGVWDRDTAGKRTEFYRLSVPIDGAEHHRRFDDSAESVKLQASQNLPADLLLFEEGWLRETTAQAGFRVELGPERATRAVDGYIFSRLDS